jgi:hypothetical protein
MSKFKKGDLVRRINVMNSEEVLVGSIGVVSSIPERRTWGGWSMKVRWDHLHRDDFNISDNLELIETPNTMNLTVTKDKVVEAASKCSTANQVLRVMFPEAFEPEKVRVPERIPNTADDGGSGSPVAVCTADFGKGAYEGCLVVRSGYSYRESKTNNGYTILTFYKK